jgi:hypothetical protein
MRNNERNVGRADHNLEDARRIAANETPTTASASDSADQRTHGAHGRGRGEEQLNEDADIEPDTSKSSDRGGSGGWGSASSGGSVVDKRSRESK